MREGTSLALGEKENLKASRSLGEGDALPDGGNDRYGKKKIANRKKSGGSGTRTRSSAESEALLTIRV